MRKWFNNSRGNVYSNSNIMINGGNVFHSTSSSDLYQVSVDQEKKFSPEDISEIEVETSSFNVNIQDSNEPQFCIQFKGKGQSSLTQEEFSQLLQIDKQGKSVYVTFQKKDLSMMNDTFELTLLIPSPLANLYVKTASGDIQLDSQHIQHMDITTSSGDIQVKNSEVQRGKVQSMSGDLKLSHIKVSSIRLKTMSGDVKLKHLVLDESIEAESMSGDIELQVSPSTSYVVQASSMSGDVTNQIPRSQNGVRIKATSMSGDIELYQ